MPIYSPNQKHDVFVQRPYFLFENACKSKATLIQYSRGLKNFKNFCKIANFNEFAKMDTQSLQILLEDYVIHLKNKNLRRITIRGCLQPVELFLEVNRIPFHKRALHLLFPKDEKKIGSEKPYLTEDIQKMLSSTTSKRNKAIIHFFASTGARPGVLVDPEYLQFRHVTSMPYGCKAILLYAETNSEYWGFLTPEASKALDEYRDERINFGEKITHQSPLFAINEKLRNQFIDRKNYLTLDSLHTVLSRILKKSKIERIKNGFRYDKAITYGFRKRFNTILKLKNNVNSNIAEKLMAHKNGLDGVYLKPTKEQCFAEFIKAIPELTINDADRFKIKLDRAELEKDEMIKAYETRMKNTEILLLELKNRLDSS